MKMKIFTRTAFSMLFLLGSLSAFAGGGMWVTPETPLQTSVTQVQGQSELLQVESHPSHNTPGYHNWMNVSYVGSPDGKPVPGVTYVPSPGNATLFMYPQETVNENNIALDNILPINTDFQILNNVDDEIQAWGNRALPNQYGYVNPNYNPVLINEVNTDAVVIRGSRAGTNYMNIPVQGEEEQVIVRGIRTENPVFELLANDNDNEVEQVEVRSVRSITAIVAELPAVQDEQIYIRGSAAANDYIYVDGVQVQSGVIQQEQVQVETEKAPESGVAAEAGELPTMNVWPNPTQGRINLEAMVPDHSEALLRVISTDGRVVQEMKLHGMDARFRTELYLHDLPAGVYHINLIAGENTLNKPVVLQR